MCRGDTETNRERYRKPTFYKGKVASLEAHEVPGDKCSAI